MNEKPGNNVYLKSKCDFNEVIDQIFTVIPPEIVDFEVSN